MNHPENFNTTAFNATIGSRQSDADQVYDIEASKLQDAVNRAFEQIPAEPMTRWLFICNALTAAEEKLDAYCNLSNDDQKTIDNEGDRLFDANDENDKAAVSQNIGSIMYVYRTAIDRAEA